jgi:hypothetical protein
VRTRWTLDSKSPIVEIVDSCGGVAGRAPLYILEVTPLPDAPRNLMVSILPTNVSYLAGATNRITHLNIETSTVVRFLHDRGVKVVQIQFSLEGNLVIGVQKIEGKDSLGPEY